MGDPAPGEARNQAVPQPVVDEPNEYDVHSPQPAQQQTVMPVQPTVQQIAVANIQFNRRKNSVLNPTSGFAGLDVSNVYSMGEAVDDIVASFGITA